MNLLFEKELTPYQSRSAEEVLDYARTLVVSNNATAFQMANELSYIMRKCRRLKEAAAIAQMMYESSPTLERLNLYFVAVVDQGDIDKIKQLSIETEQALHQSGDIYQKHLFATWLKAANKICDEKLFDYIYSRIPGDEKRLNPYIVSQFYVYLNRIGKYQDVVDHYSSLEPHIQDAFYVKRYYNNARTKLGLMQPHPSRYRTAVAEYGDVTTIPASDSPSDPLRTDDVKQVFLVYGGQPNMLPVIESLLRSNNVPFVNLANEVKTGKTIIEAFEAHAAASSFAIVLMTPENEGQNDVWYPRQNVVLEYGYFAGKLGRQNVCVLCDDQGKNLDIPSDIAGIYRIYMNKGTWIIELGKALKEAGFTVNF